MAHEWIINNDKYEGQPRWYTCPICKYTYDNFVDHVSETRYCPNCKNEMGEKRKFYRWSSDLSGGLVIATSLEDALDKLEKKYADVREKIRDFAIWPWESDDYYDTENPDVFDVYE